MTKNLVIVESPAKSKTIEKYLGKDYKVVSSKGHIRDLATTGKFGLGVDIDDGFKPSYIPIPRQKKLITELKKDVKEADKIFLASDPDREGEAISWHLYETLKLKDDNYYRVTFNEITKNKVLDAINNPGKINEDLVHSQEARRILDRIIGFRLSKLLQSKIKAKSAGRVQSVALKLIVDREREIEAFVKEEYWTMTAVFDDFESILYKYKDEEVKLEKEEDTKAILDELSDEYKVVDVSLKKKNKKSKYPFTTSTMQQEAATKLGFNAKKTMMIAQKLYEGLDIGNETTGLITYMRTDSIRLSDDFVKSLYAYITNTYGKEYVGYIKESKKSDNVQDAHEAIRPTNINNTPEKIKAYLTPDEFKLYSLIYKRTVASLMADATVNQTTILFNNNDYIFKTTGQTLVFDGYLKVYIDYESSEDKLVPNLEVNQVKNTSEVLCEQHFTQPKPRYTEAKLIKEMEELGIGRPSTYAKTMDTIKERNYVILEDKKFKPTDMGIETTDKLQEFFSDIINVEYTKEMEEELDDIASGKLVWNKVLDNFYKLFAPRVEEAFKDMEKKEATETGEICPECNSPLVIRTGRYGEFTACSNYPECKYIKKEKKEEKIIMKCPECDGNILEKPTRKGKIFYGCSNYPKCKFASWDKPLEESCPECGKYLTTKNNVIKCSNCQYEKK